MRVTCWSRGPSALALTTALLSGCLSPVEVELPHVEGAQAAFVLVATSGSVEARAFDLTRERLTVSLAVGREREKLVIFTKEPLSDLGVTTRRVETPKSALTRTLPRPLRAFAVGPRASPEEPFIDVTTKAESSPTFQAVLLDILPEACAAGGGCTMSGAPGRCLIPCPPPNPPEAPIPPALPRFECGAWPKARADILGLEARGELAAIEACAPRAFTSCPDGEYFTSTEGCIALAGSCSEWPAVEGVPVVYVRPGADGDGTRERPFGELRPAVARAAELGADAVVALAPQPFSESVSVDGDTRWVGCLETELRGRVTVTRGALRLEDVSLTEGGSIRVEAEAGLVASGLRVARRPAVTPWLDVAGNATVSRARVSDASGSISVTNGALRLVSSAFEPGEGPSIQLEGRAHAMIEDIAASARLRTCSRPDSCPFAEVNGGTAELRRAVFDASTAKILKLSGAARVNLEDGIIRGTLFRGPAAVEVRGQASFSGSRLLVLDRSLLAARDQAEATLSNVLGGGTTTATAASNKAPWILLDESAKATLRRVAVVQAPNGIRALTRTMFSVEDLVLEDLRSDGTGAPWACLALQGEPTVSVERVRISRCAAKGFALEGTEFPQALEVVLSDVHIEDTAGEGLVLAKGFTFNTDNRARLTRARVTAAHFQGIVLDHFATLRDVTVTEMALGPPCQNRPCERGALHLGRTANLDLERFIVSGAPQDGITLRDGAILDARVGRIEENANGILILELDNLPNPEDHLKLDQVVFEQNGKNFEVVLPPR